MSRRRFGFARWKVRADECLPMVVFEVQCRTCQELSGGADNSAVREQKWALEHTGRNPAHREFVMTARTFWRTEPCDGNPYSEVAP